MQPILRLLLTVSFCAASFHSKAQYDTLLTRQIAEMIHDDQWARHLLDTVYKYGRTPVREKIVWDIIHAMDTKHNKRLWQLVRELRSYPDNILVGSPGAANFWALVQHQDDDTALQKHVLELMKYAVNYNPALKTHYAYLVDRVRLNTGQKQLYGTQFIMNQDSTAYIPRPLEDSALVDERRKLMGIPPIDSYSKTMNGRYKAMLRRK